MQLLVIIGMVIAACGVVFAIQNNVVVTVAFLLWRFDSSLAIVLLFALVLGGIIIALVSTPSTLKRQWLIAKQRKQIAELEHTCREQKVALKKLEKSPAAEPPASI